MTLLFVTIVIPKNKSIMEYPTLRFVFDRKKVATKEKKGLVQIEVCSERKRKWIGTGVKVYADQWDDKRKVTARPDSLDLNMKLDLMMSNILEYVNSLIRRKVPFDFESLDVFLKNSSESDSFIDFIVRRTDERKDRAEGTIKHYRTLVKVLEDFGRINYFHDLTRSNITMFDDYLRSKGIKDTTVYGYHKNMKAYINEAIRFGIISENPYVGLKINRGKSDKRKYLTYEEMRRMERCRITDPSVNRVRDLFLFQCYTGLAYSDLYKFDFASDVERRGNKFIIADRRVKTNEDYFIVLLSPAMDILKKYDFDLPVISNQKYNDYLKVAASFAKIDKNLTTHCARHTFAVFALNNGVPMEVVSKMLGHTNIKTTQIYAKVLNTEVEKGFDVLERKMKV